MYEIFCDWPLYLTYKSSILQIERNIPANYTFKQIIRINSDRKPEVLVEVQLRPIVDDNSVTKQRFSQVEVNELDRSTAN